MEVNQIYSNITEYSTLKESTFPYSKYISYTIRITTNEYNWNVTKRFKNFEELHLKLTKLKLFVPKLPTKKFFFNLSKDFIEERMESLEQYLNEILSKNNLNNCLEILEFIELDQDTFHIFLGKNKSFSNKNESFINKFNKSILNKSNDEMKKSKSGAELFDTNKFKMIKPKINTINNTGKGAIMDFLRNLSTFPQNKTMIVKDFLNINLKAKNMQKLKRYEIGLLLFGDNTINGLFYHCGNFADNKIGAESCLNLLSKLISSEYNILYEEFIDVIKSASKEHIKSINLDLHFKGGNERMKNTIYKIIQLLIEDKMDDSKMYSIEEIINDLELSEKIQSSFYEKYNYDF